MAYLATFATNDWVPTISGEMLSAQALEAMSADGTRLVAVSRA